MGPWGWKHTVFCVQYNKSKLFHSCSDLLFFLQKEKTSLNLSLNFKRLNSATKCQDSLVSIYLILLKGDSVLWLLFLKLIKSFANLNVKLLPAISQNPSVSFLSSDTETKPTHLIYKTCWLGLPPSWFPTSLACFSVFLPVRHRKTILFVVFRFFFNASRCDSLGEYAHSISSSMGCGGITVLIPCWCAPAWQCQHLLGL